MARFPLPLAIRLAARELRSGVRGFRIFLACLALGVAAIAAAGSTAEAFRQGLASQAREILGGDLSFSIENRDFTRDERAAIDRLGRTTYSAGARAMAQASNGERRLVSLRGVDERFPLAGAVKLEGAPSLAAALADRDGLAGAAVEPALMDRLNLKIGDRFEAGTLTLVVRARLLSEPDGLSRGFALAPRVLIRSNVLDRSGLLAPGGLSSRTVRIALPPGQNPRAAGQAIQKAFPDAHFRVRDRLDAAPGARRLIDQLEYFLGFIGLASLVAGGLGVAGAVSAYLSTREPAIAVLKALGARSSLIRDLHLIQIGVLALLGVTIGLAVGAAAPLLLGQMAGSNLPIPALFKVYPWPLAKAGLFGLLAAAAFSLVPLARARATPPSALFRRAPKARLPLGLETAGAVGAGLGLAALAVATAPTPMAAAIMIAGVAVAFGLLAALGRGAAFLAGRVRGVARGPIKLGLANLAGPRSAAHTASPAIGLGVALLACVVLIQSALLAQVSDVAPRTAPAMVFTEIPADGAEAFDAVVAGVLGSPSAETYLRMPFATGRIVAVKGKPVDPQAVKPSQRWAFDNDITLSLLAQEPKNAGVVAGQWWRADYAGPPQVAMNVEVAQAAGLKVGDAITVLILGREIEARIADLRSRDAGRRGPAQRRDRAPRPRAGGRPDPPPGRAVSGRQCDQRPRAARGRRLPVRPAGARGARRGGGRWPGGPAGPGGSDRRRGAGAGARSRHAEGPGRDAVADPDRLCRRIRRGRPDRRIGRRPARLRRRLAGRGQGVRGPLERGLERRPAAARQRHLADHARRADRRKPGAVAAARARPAGRLGPGL